jgi:prepilin-type N-terminal cleavage/methylation domain-containing protein
MSGPAGERGLTLLECAAALAVAGIVLVTGARVNEASASLIRYAKFEAETVTVARSLLEHELGAPCGAAFDCPAGYRCAVSRAPVAASADHLVARVERVDGEAAQELRTLAPVPACGG